MIEGELAELLGGDETTEVRPWTLEQSILVARLLFYAGRAGDADRRLRPLVRVHPDRAELLKLWAQIKHARGQLTEAIRAFEGVHAMVPAEPSALGHLELIHRMSQHPEAARRELELELVGDEALARLHRAQHELERAFRLAAAQKFTSAVDVCERVAERHKTSDPNIFKLALLEKSFLLESIGQFDGAVQTLERLGGTRGFEVDRDRLLCLARTYERRNTGDDLSRAMKVYSYLYEQTGASEYLSRMARLAERKQDTAAAAKLNAEFMRAFRVEQQELELPELLEAATLCFVPLAMLKPLAPPREELEAELSRTTDERHAAILRALNDDLEGAAEIWRSLLAKPGSRPEDAKYFADLRERAGDFAGARALYLAALSNEEVADAFVLTKLLATEEEALSRGLGPIFRDAEKARRTHEALISAAKGHQLSPEVWLTLARFEKLVGLSKQADRHSAKAAALARVRDRTKNQIGHVQVAAVYEFQGKKRGLVHEIWASRYRVGSAARSGAGGQLDEASIFGNIAQDMMRDIQNVFVAVRVFVQEKFPHLVEDLEDYRYVLKVTKDDEPSGGNSAGTAVALAFISVFLQRPVPRDFAITGSLVADSSSELRLNRVADIDYKVLGIYQRRLSRLIAPMENRIDLEASNIVPRTVWENRVGFARNLTQVMKLVFGDDLWEW